MGFRSTYTGRYQGIGRMLQRPGMQRATAKAARRVMNIAEGLAPVGDPAYDRHAGEYKASFRIEPLVKNVKFRGKPRLRAGSRLLNTSPHAWRVEHGDGRVPRYAVLGRSIDIAKATYGR